MALLWTSTVHANPVGEQVVGGAASFERVGNSLTIQQGTDRAVINWNNFSIGAGETTKFVMPSASSAALNRVLSGNPSAIYGNLQANGHLFLINPAGIMVGPGGTINAASFLASTHDVDPAAFMKGGDLNLLGQSAASILNQGKIEASSGDVFLIAQHVENEGQIMARDGTVGMVSGTQVTLQSVGPQGFKVRLMDVPDEQARVKTKEGLADIVNEGVIEAANVMLESTGNIGSLAINNTGTIRATGVRANADGSVSLIGGQGDVANSGVVAALRKNLEGGKTGGDIQIAGRNITTEDSSLVTAAGAAGGGYIQMRGSDTTLISGRVEATGFGDQSKGGRVELLGKNVGLRSGEVNADGGAKGGTVLVGGDYLGLNPEVPNAKATVITPDARISASATVKGDGGKVVVWSDEYTGFFGGITALGGPEGGNGGFIETSSKNNLQVFGEAQASAAKGLPGEWLLDPSNVIVSDQNTSGGWFSPGNPTIFTPFFVDTAYILNTQINNALDLGTSVTITTGSATTLDCGVISINAPITKTFGGNATLTLDSDSGIIINADITSVSSSLFMNFQADSNQDGFGTFTLAGSANLFSNGGNITVSAGDVILDGTMNTLKVIQAPVTVNDGGSYAVGTVPTVAIAPPVATGGVEASAIALMGIETASVVNGGSGYTGMPTVRIIGGGGQNAVLTPSMGVPTGSSAVTIAIAGSGYNVGDTVSLSGGGGSGATGVVTSVGGGGAITGVAISSSGSGYTFLPSANVNSGTGTGACIEINQLFVAGVSVVNPGTGYTGAMTLQINGGGGSGAAAQVDTVQVVNLSFDGTSVTPDVAAPSYGVGYAAGQTLTTAGGDIIFSGGGGADVSIGSLVNVAGDIILKPSASGTGIGVGTGIGDFSVSNPELGRLSVTGSILPGTITVGSRAAGALSVGGLNPGNQNLTLSAGGTLTGVSAEGAGDNITMTGGLLTLDTAGAIGAGSAVGTGLQINSPRVAVITEGNFFNLYNTATLTQFHVTTDGTVATQRMVDNQPGTSNLNWTVTELASGTIGGNTTINGITVINDSVNLRYQNSLGNILVAGGGVSSVLVDSRNSAATAVTFSAPTLPGGVQATGTIAAGLVTITNPGSGYALAPVVALTGGVAGAVNAAGLGTLNVQSANNGVPANFRDFQLSAPSGSITTAVSLFSGGGNLTLQAQDLFLPVIGGGSLNLTDIPGLELPSVAYANLGVLNTFQAVPDPGIAGSLIFIGGAFGSRVPLMPNQNGAGAIQGTGGVLSIEPTAGNQVGRRVDLSPAGGFVNSMNISVRETQLLEAPGVRIGGLQTSDILLRTMNTPLIFRQTVTTRNPGGNPETTSFDYDPRYFENPFFLATRNGQIPVNVSDNSGIPHVLGGTVALVSALGEVRNVQGGDVNVDALTMTGVNGVFFDARSQNGTYPALTLASANGSIVGAISARAGRTLQDGSTIGNGGDVTLNLNPSTDFINDGRLPNNGTTTLVVSDYTSNQEATASVSLAGGQISSIDPVNTGGLYRYEPVVTLTGGGVQEASLRAVLNETGVALIAPQIVGQGYTPSVLDPSTGTTTGPDVSIIGNGTGALVGNGGKAFISDNGILSVFSVTDGGSGYNPAAPPQVIISGGGSGVTRPAVARTEVNSAGQVTGLIVVDPGAGYDNTPVSVLVQAPSSGGRRAQAVLDNDFQPANFGGTLNPVYVSAAGTGYTVEPTVAITGGGIRQAQARAVLQNNPSSDLYGRILGYVVTDAGLGYTTAPTVTVGSGQAFGNFGEYGVSTETVDRNVGSGNISISNGPFPLVGGLILNAPVKTGDAQGVPGGDAITGSILLDIYVDLAANSNNSLAALAPDPGGARGIIITGDASLVPGASSRGNTRSGSVTILARSIQNNTGAASTLATLTGSAGMPIQIGTATGGISNIPGNLSAELQLRDATNTEVGDLQIYAPAPGEVQVALGNLPLDPNHRQSAPRTSNDLYLSGLRTPETGTDAGGNTQTDESLVTVEVGAFEGKLTLLRRAESQAIATVINGRVTLITPDQGGQLFVTEPTVVITGGGVTPAEASVFVRDGTLVAPNGGTQLTLGNGLDVAGQGYYVTPDVTFQGGGGSGAQAVAVINSATGAISSIQITNPGYGYTSLPQVVIGAPAGIQAEATAAIPAGTTGNVQADITVAGVGYPVAPLVAVSGGLYGTATATATVNAATQIATITINVGTDVFPSGVATLTIAPPSGAAQATAVLQNGLVTGFSIESPGGGYSSAPTVLLTTGNATPYDLTLDRVGFIADRLQLFDATTPANVLIEAGLVAIAPWTNQRPVNLGAVRPGASSYLAADLQRFLTDDLVVGRRNPDHIGVGAGEITVSTALASDNLRIANGFFLAGTRGLTDQAGTTGISFQGVSINVGSTVSLTGGGNKIHYLAGLIQGPFEELTYAKSFTLQNALLTQGTTILPLTIAEVFGNPAYFTGQRFNQGITTQNGDVSLLSDLLEQSRLVGYIDTTGGGRYPVGSLSSENYAGSSTVTLAPLTAGRSVSIYYNNPGSGLGLRIGNPASLGLEQVRAGAIKIGSSSSGSITFNSDFGFNYLTYPEAPRALILETGGSIILGISQVPPSPIPAPKTSSILVPNLSLTAAGSVSIGTVAGTAAPTLRVSNLAANLTGAGQSLSFTTTQPELTIADFGPLGGATGIRTAAGGNVTINVPGSLVVPLMPPQLQASPANTTIVPSTINSGGNITLNSTAAGGTISIAVVNNFDTSGWNNPVPSGSTVNPTILAGSANAIVTMTADRIEIGDNGVAAVPPGLLTPPLIAANLATGRVILQPLTAGSDIVLGGTKGANFTFTGTELGNIQANVLQVGNATAGDISIETLVQLSVSRLSSALSLIGNGTISDLGVLSATGIQYAGGLRLSGNGVISFESLRNQFGTVAADSLGTLATPNDITLTSTAFSIGTVDTLTGITASESRVTLQTSGPPSVPIPPAVPINLGTKTGWSFTDTELDLVTADTLQIGRNDGVLASGAITISAAISPANISTLSLWTGAGIINNPSGTAGVSVGSFAIRAGGPVSMGGVLNGTTGNTDTVNSVANFAAEISGAGALEFADLSPLTVTQVDGITGITTAGAVGDDVILTADQMALLEQISTGAGDITLQPLTQATNISLNDNSNSLQFDNAELGQLSSSGTVTIGRANGTGTFNIGGLGAINLTGGGFSLQLRGQDSDVSFNQDAVLGGGVTLAPASTFTFDVGAGAVTTTTAPSAITDITIGDGTTGTLVITSAGAFGTSAAPILTSLANLGGADVGGQIYLRNAGALDLTGDVSAEGPLYLSSSAGAFTNSGQTITTTSGALTLEGDTLVLTGPGNTVTGTSAGIFLQPFTPSRALNVFTSGAGGFEVNPTTWTQLSAGSPVTIGRTDSSGNVVVDGLNPIGRSLTIQSPLLPNAVPGPQGTFNVNGALDSDSSGANIILNAGGGIFTSASTISAGDVATRNGTVSITAQTINLGGLVTANGPGGEEPGILLANGISGDTYLANSAGAGANDLVVGAGTLVNLSSTGPVFFGRLTNPDGSASSDNVYVGALTVGAGGFPFGGLGLLAGNLGMVELRGDLISNSKPILINGPLVLSGNRAIAMNGVGTGANLSILNGIRGNPTTADLTLTMGTGANTLTLAGGQTTDRMGTLTINLGGASIVLGSTGLGRGLNLGFTDSFALPANATLQGGPINLQVEGAGNSLTTQNLTGAQSLSLTTTGANGAITAGTLNVQNLAVSAGSGGVVTLQAVTAVTGVTMAADSFVLNGTVAATAGNVSLTKATLSSPMVLGVGGDLDAAGLLRLQAPAGEVILGTGTTGGIQLIGPINLASSGTQNYALNGSAGGVTFSGTGPVLNLPANGNLRISAGTGSVIGSGTTDVAGANASLSIDSAGSVNLLTDIGFYGPANTATSNGNITMVNAGSVAIDGAFDAGTGTVLVRTLSGNLTLASTMAGGTIQLGAFRNFNNQVGASPFTNRNGGRTFVYSFGQGYDTPYNFAGLQGFGVAFGRGFGSTIGSGNMLIYSAYAQVALDYGVVYYEMFSGNSVSALLAMDSSLFRSINGQGIPKAQPGGYIDYMLYPQRVEPAGMTLPAPSLSRLARELGRPPTVEELADDTVRQRQSRMLRAGAVLERNSFDERPAEPVETVIEERAEWEGGEAYPYDGQIPQAQLPAEETGPTAAQPAALPDGKQASKKPIVPPTQTGPNLRRGNNRAVALREESGSQRSTVQATNIIEEERMRAEFGTAKPVAGQVK